MKTQIAIITLLFAMLLTGCDVNKEEHQRVLTELEETKQALEQSQSEVSTASSRVDELTVEVDRLKKQDTYAFTEAGRLLDAGDLNGALQAYTSFIRDFPSSSQIVYAKSQISAIEPRLDAQRREAGAQAELERKENEQRELAAKLRQGMLTVPQLIPYLRGKTKDQVTDLFGPPVIVFSGGNELAFSDKAYSTLLRSNDTILHVKFSGGIVYAVALGGEEEYSAR